MLQLTLTAERTLPSLCLLTQLQRQWTAKKLSELHMEKKKLVEADSFVFGYVLGGSPVSWRYKWCLEGLHMKVSQQAFRQGGGGGAVRCRLLESESICPF